MSNLIDIQHLAKDHAGEKALRDLSMQVPDPCLFGIIGADGAGKSTLMNILSTLMNPDSGTGTILGLDLATRFQGIRSDIGYMPQRFSLYQDLSVQENLDFFADIFGIHGHEKTKRMNHLLQFANLTAFKGRRAGLLSGGMKQKLALACTLIHQPKLLLLDEPTVGVDPVARQDFWSMLKSLRAQGITLVVSTPYMDEAALCDQLVLLHEGAILAQGTPSHLLSEYPYQLFRIEATGATLTYAADKTPPPGIALIYPSGGCLHAAESKSPSGSSSLSTAEVLASIKAHVPKAISAKPIEPTLEDFFFALLNNNAVQKKTYPAQVKV
jgi:ABC-2 type transport system ATP-binding protein